MPNWAFFLVVAGLVTAILFILRQVLSRRADDGRSTAALPQGEAVAKAIASEDRLPQGTELPVLDLKGEAASYELRVAGVTHHLEAFATLLQRRGLEASEEMPPVPLNVLLLPEPTNPHDANAVRVLDEAGALLGYLPRADAKRYQPCFDLMTRRGYAGTCPALLTSELLDGDEEEDAEGLLPRLTLNLKPAGRLLADLRETFAGAATNSTTAEPEVAGKGLGGRH